MDLLINQKGMRGFTLVEAIVTILVLSLIMIAISLFIIMSYRFYGHTLAQATAINEARTGIEIMVKEIRETKTGDNGSYPIVLADDKELIFFSDIDKDGETERVRYFLGTTNSGSQVLTCVTFSAGGSCSVNFSNFLLGTLQSAQLKVSVEGDFGWKNKEYATIYVDGTNVGDVCRTGCSDCAGVYGGTTIFDVAGQAQDGALGVLAQASLDVDNACDWEEPNHFMKARFELSWVEELGSGQKQLKKGVIDPQGPPIRYPPDQEKLSVLSHYVQNTPPIFEYFDENSNKIVDYPARLKDTRMMKVFLIVDADLNRDPQPFELESQVQLRNLKDLQEIYGPS